MATSPAHVVAPKLSSRLATFYGRLVLHLPGGMCVLHLRNPAHQSTWRLVAANALVKRLAGAEVGRFLSLPVWGRAGINSQPVDLARAVRLVWEQRRNRMLGYHAARTRFHPAGVFALRALPLDDNCVAVLFEDVTQSAMTKRAQQAAESRLQQICTSARAILWTADPATLECHTVTPEAMRLLGYWPERWQHEVNFLQNHTHPDDWELLRSRCARAVLEEAPAPFDLRMFDNDGRPHWFQVHLSAGGTPSAQRELSGVMVEITDQKRNEQAAVELSARVMQVQEKERKRISRDLHDSVGQYLTGLHWSLKRLQREDGLPAGLREEVAECARTAQVCMEEVRAVSYALHPPAIDMLGLGPALEWQARRFAQQSGLQIHLDVSEGITRLGPDAEIALFRVFQECLSNIRRHANTDAAFVRLCSENGHTQLEVEDRGVGMPAQESANDGHGIGIHKMRERLKDLGGSLEFISRGSGTLVRARVPMGAAPSRPQAAPMPPVAARARTAAAAAPRIRRLRRSS